MAAAFVSAAASNVCSRAYRSPAIWTHPHWLSRRTREMPTGYAGSGFEMRSRRYPVGCRMPPICRKDGADGLGNAPVALQGLFDGTNVGKAEGSRTSASPRSETLRHRASGAPVVFETEAVIEGHRASILKPDTGVYEADACGFGSGDSSREQRLSHAKAAMAGLDVGRDECPVSRRSH